MVNFSETTLALNAPSALHPYLESCDATQRVQFLLARLESFLAENSEDDYCCQALDLLLIALRELTLGQHPDWRNQYLAVAGSLVEHSRVLLVLRPKTLDLLMRALLAESFADHSDRRYCRGLFSDVLRLFLALPVTQEVLMKRNILESPATFKSVENIFEHLLLISGDHPFVLSAEKIERVQRVVVMKAVGLASEEELERVLAMTVATVGNRYCGDECEAAARAASDVLYRERVANSIYKQIDADTNSLSGAYFDIEVSEQDGALVIDLGSPGENDSDLDEELLKEFQERYEAETLPTEDPDVTDDRSTLLLDLATIFKDIIPSAVEEARLAAAVERDNLEDRERTRGCIVMMNGHRYILP